MSHTGRRNFRRIYNNRDIPETAVVPVVEDVTISGRLESDILEGEITGNGSDIIVGLSNNSEYDRNTVFLTNQKGIAIGYLEGSVNFCAFSNNGSGAATTVTPFPVPKDKSTHLFKIQRSLTKIECWLDITHKVTLTTNIPPFGEQLKVISYGLY